MTCCLEPATLSMSAYIDAGWRRRRLPPLPVVGSAEYDDEGRFVQFSVAVAAGRIVDVRFRVSSCVSLIGYCEVAARLLAGIDLTAVATNVRATDLVQRLPDVPEAKRPRALLVRRAIIAVLRRATQDREHNS